MVMVRLIIPSIRVEVAKKLIREYGLSEKEVDVLISDSFLANFFEEANKEVSHPQSTANWLLGPFLELVNSLQGGKKTLKSHPIIFPEW